MYHLLRVRNLGYYKTGVIKKQLSSVSSIRPCTFCKRITYTDPSILDRLADHPINIRHHSTHYNIASIHNELEKRKRFRIQKKKYTEILEILGGSHSETKARVKNLKPNDFALLLDNPNVSLEHLHELKRQLKQRNKSIGCSTNNQSVEIIPSQIDGSNLNPSVDEDLDTYRLIDCNEESEFNESLIIHEDETVPIESSEQDKDVLHNISTNTDNKSSDSPKNIKKGGTARKILSTYQREQRTRDELAKVKYTELQKAAKLENLNSVLLAYLDACVSCGFLNRGLSTLQFYVKRTSHNKLHIKPTDIRIIDVLLKAFASKGKMEKLEEVWGISKGLNMNPSYNSYAARLECLMRSEQSSLEDKINDTISEMKDQEYTLHGLFETCTFLGDQRDIVLEAIRKVQPSFRPTVNMPDMCYSCSLLEHLNQKNTDTLRSPADGLFTSEQLKKLAVEQFKYEIKGTIPIKSIEKRKETSPNVHIYRQNLDGLKKMWEKAILKGIERDISTLNSAQNSMKTFRFATLFPYLKVLEPEQYKDIIMAEICKLAEGSEAFSPTTLQLYRDLGKKVKARYIVKYKQQHGVLSKTQQLYDDYCDWYVNPNCRDYISNNSRQEWQQQVYNNQEGASVYMEETNWPMAVLVGLGKFLYNIILHDIKIDMNCLRVTDRKTKDYLPAFYLIFRRQNNRCVEEIKPHPILSKLFRATEQEHLQFDVNLVPMVCPPLPWTTVNSGGYLVLKTDFIRLPFTALLQRTRLDEVPPPQLYPSFDALNQLGYTPWKVNSPVLDIVMEVFNNGGSSKLDIPEAISACPQPDPITPEMTKLERFKAYRQRLSLKRKKAEMYSLWCDALYRLSLANHFRNRAFWLPHNMDFRGRVYPCPPHLNHLGSDMARSLLCFAKGKRLGPTGLDWLKIHVVNLTGLKKKNSVIDRLVYANEIIDDIIDSAQHPLTGRMWWAESECPWQTLACCMEIWAALQHPGGPESFVSHFPVHQDGSCNGLQHYAALGRDRAGAESVNLSFSPVPQDVYSCVAAIVERERAKDAANNLRVAQVLDGFIQRKVIKQTVMTTVYGVTRYGAKLQIAKQLKDIEAFPKEFVWSASTYLACKTFESLREMFTSTREIQDWFTECARLIAQICGQNVEYVTPLGLPVVQPYIRQKQIKMNIQKRLDTANEQFSVDTFERPNVMKQKNAFPPNFIHSLDSSHMMLTSLHCEQHGITYVSVHDCFWTHPCTVPIMNKICRQQFVALHSQPILEDLSAFLTQKFGYPENDIAKLRNKMDVSKKQVNSVLCDLPPVGEFNLENVLDSVYFFS